MVSQLDAAVDPNDLICLVATHIPAILEPSKQLVVNEDHREKEHTKRCIYYEVISCIIFINDSQTVLEPKWASFQYLRYFLLLWNDRQSFRIVS